MFIKSNYILHVFVLLGIWIALTDSLNLVTGFAGQLALGHAAFVSIGAYAGALLIVHANWSFWPSLLIGGVVSSLAGLILGLLALRLRGDYLGMVTMGFGEIIRILSINLIGITGGQGGLVGVHRPAILGYKFSSEVEYYFLILVLVIIIHYAIERLLMSRFGRACLAIRDDEVAAAAMGVKSYSYKVLAFAIACGMAGIVGVFYAGWMQMINPTGFALTDSIMISVMQTLGGIGSLFGSIPGAVIIGGLPELLRPITTGTQIASLRTTFMGLLMVILLIVRPEGLYGISLRRGFISLKWLHKLFINKKELQQEEIQDVQCAVDDGILLSSVKYAYRDTRKPNVNAD